MMNRSLALAAFLILAPLPALAQPASLDALLAEAERFEPLETVLVAIDGETVAERGYGNHSVTAPTNIKSASKTVISALIGMAIERGVIEGVDQPIADFLADDMPGDADPRLGEITVGNLLSMQAGLAPTSGGNYGRWVTSRNWVRSALDQPFQDDPGGRMLYSTGSSHLLSAILTKASGRSTLELARDWFGPVDDFAIGGWERDPQGIYLGGNQMAMSPRSLLAFGEVFRNGGLAPDGTALIGEDWIEQSWTQRTNSRFTGDGYGYGWFLREVEGEDVRYAWGYGGQMLYVVPELNLTVAMTSDENAPSAGNGHRDALHDLLGEIIKAVRDTPEPETALPS